MEAGAANATSVFVPGASIGGAYAGLWYGSPPISDTPEHKVFIDKKDNSTSFTGNVDKQDGIYTTQFLVDQTLSTSDGHAQIGKGGGNAIVYNSMTFFLDNPDVAGDRWDVIHDFVFDTGGHQSNGNNDLTVTGYLNGGGPLFQQTVTGLKGGDLTWMLLGVAPSNIFDTIVVSSIGGFEFIKHMYVSGSGPGIDPRCTVDCGGPSPVPLPAGVWLFGTALAGIGALKVRRRRRAEAA